MINEILKALSYVVLVFGGAIVMSLLGVSILLLGEHLLEKWKERKRK